MIKRHLAGINKKEKNYETRNQDRLLKNVKNVKSI